jgi:hypothetical protein
MGDKQLAIIGLHNPMALEVQEMLFRAYNFNVKTASDLSTMIGLVQENPNARLYLMDVNLGFSGEDNGKPCFTIYEMVQDRPNAVFIGTTATQGAIDDAVKRGVPREYLAMIPLPWEDIEKRLERS